jgi:hypothetical protein
MFMNLDPPSDSVNESKLNQNLRSCDGMVAVLPWRATGPSKYILFEIGLSLRARKPVMPSSMTASEAMCCLPESSNGDSHIAPIFASSANTPMR